MIAIALAVTMMTVGLAVGCAAVDIRCDEQERRLKGKTTTSKGRLRDWYAQRGAGRRHFARSGQFAHREPYGRRHLAGLPRFR